MRTRGFIFGRRWREVVQRAFLESPLMPCARRQIFAKPSERGNENPQRRLASSWTQIRGARPAASPPPGLGSENPRHTSTGHAKVQR